MTGSSVERLTRLIKGEAVEPKPLDQVDAATGNPLEVWARVEAERLGVDLGLMLPLALVMVSAACNGAVRVRMPDYQTVTTVQFIGLAESGIGKTTVLRAGNDVMADALEAMENAMAGWVASRVADGQSPPAGGWDPADWAQIYRAGLCKGGTMIGSATQEALRNGLAENGSHQVIWTAESDILEEIGRYSKDAGSVSMIIHGWDGEDIAVRRVKDGVIRARRASLPMAVLIQPDVFDDITAAGVFTSKGVLHRTLITASGPAGLEVPPVDTGFTGPLEMARGAFSVALQQLAVATSPYRSWMAATAAWVGAGGLSLGVPRPTAVPGRVLALDGGAAAVDAYKRVQEARRDVRRAAMEATDLGMSGGLWEPLCSRLTDHVLRVAGNYRLALDPDAVVLLASDLDDALDRVLPWLWEHWAVAMVRRGTVVVENGVLKGMKDNPKGKDTSLEGHILYAFGVLMRRQGLDVTKPGAIVPGQSGPSFTKSEVLRCARDLLNGDAKRTAYTQLKQALDRMVTVGDYVEDSPMGGYNGHKRVQPTGVGMVATVPQMK